MEVLNITPNSSIDREESGSAERPIYVDVSKATQNSDNVTSCNHPISQVGKRSKPKARYRRMPKIKDSFWDGVQPIICDQVPHYIDGKCVFKLSYDKKDRLKSSKDGRPWGSSITASTKLFAAGARKLAKCSGSYECIFEECMYKKEFQKTNHFHFKHDIGTDQWRCGVCFSIAKFVECPALKVWEFSDDYVIIKHQGNHTRVAKTMKKSQTCLPPANEAPPSRLKLKEIQRKELLTAIIEGKTKKELQDTAKRVVDTKKIANEQQASRKAFHPLGYSLDALKRLKMDVSKHDKYYIYEISDSGLSGSASRSCVFKASHIAAKIAVNMDRKRDHFLNREYVYFDGNHKRCQGFKTLGAYVYHPLLRRMVRLASMEVENEDSGAVEIFWTIFNKVLSEVTGISDYKFDPTGWVCDEAGANWKGLERVFGDVKSRCVSCTFHYKDSVNKHAQKLSTPKEQEKFKYLAWDLQKAATVERFDETYTKLKRFISKKAHGEDVSLRLAPMVVEATKSLRYCFQAASHECN